VRSLNLFHHYGQVVATRKLESPRCDFAATQPVQSREIT
jgi:hypothetical protein